MPFDLTGLAALGSSIPGAFQQSQANQANIVGQQLRNRAAAQDLRRQQIEDQANIAAGLGLIDDTSQYSPPPASGPSIGSSPVGQASAPMSPMRAEAKGLPAPTPPPATAPPTPPPSGGSTSGGSNPLDPYSIAARIKKANPNISPAALFKATAQTIQMMGPLAQNQYKQDLLQLRMDMQTDQLNEKIREADQKYQQTNDKLALQQDAINLRLQIVQLQQQGANQRAIDRLTSQVEALAAKAGVAPTGDAKADLGATAAANAGKSDAKTLDKQISDTQKDYDNTLKENSELLRANGGFPPKEGTPDRAKYDGNIRQRDALKKKLGDLKSQRAKAPAAAPAAAPASALPDDLPNPKGLAEGTAAKDDSGKVVAVIKGGQWTAPGQ